MNNLQIFTSEKQIDVFLVRKVKAVLLKINRDKMPSCLDSDVFKFCYYVAKSYEESLEHIK